MSNTPTPTNFSSLKEIVIKGLRDSLNNYDFVLLFAYNRTGKTRLSMEFKQYGKERNSGNADTLYFNAFTEDLFSWDNDLEEDSQRYLKINSDSKFFAGFRELALDERIESYLERYTDFKFDIDYDNWTISFSKQTPNPNYVTDLDEIMQMSEHMIEQDFIKISRGEENIFIWSVFLSLCELVIDGDESYDWVKYLYIDDPISSLDDNNAIKVASDLAQLLKKGRGRVKTVISSHHALFFNVMWNELKKFPIRRDGTKKYKSYKAFFYHRPLNGDTYTLRATDDAPLFEHVAILSELQEASESGKLYTHHFNQLRGIMEKTASFLGYNDFSACIHGIPDENLYSRALNLLSHRKYSAFEPREMVEDNKDLFKRILRAFLDRYRFQLPTLLAEEQTQMSNQQ